MFEYVKNLGLVSARPYTKRSKTDMIILHHFATNASVKAVHLYHKALGHKGIDYNVVIQLDGMAVWGRGLEYEGGHVRNYGVSKGMNARSIGIVCQGNFQKSKMSDEQRETLFRVIRDCLKKYPDIDEIVGHGELYATACPGKYYPLKEAKALLREEPAPAKKAPAVKFTLKRNLKLRRVRYMRGADVKAVQKVLVALGYNIGSAGVDGVYGKKTYKAVREFQAAKGLVVDGIVGPITAAALGGKWG